MIWFQVPLHLLVKSVLGKYPNYSNMVVWLSIIIGQPLAIFCYVHDYYVSSQRVCFIFCGDFLRQKLVFSGNTPLTNAPWLLPIIILMHVKCCILDHLWKLLLNLICYSAACVIAWFYSWFTSANFMIINISFSLFVAVIYCSQPLLTQQWFPRCLVNVERRFKALEITYPLKLTSLITIMQNLMYFQNYSICK